MEKSVSIYTINSIIQEQIIEEDESEEESSDDYNDSKGQTSKSQNELDVSNNSQPSLSPSEPPL